MVSRIVQAFGSRLPSNPDQKAFPTPKQIASVSLEEFSDKAKMGYRNVHVHKIATDIVSGALDLESWQDQSIPSADLYKHLLSLPGIGPYAASCLLIYLGHYDCVNVDSWARTLVSRELGKPVNDKEVHAFFEPYGKWKALVYHFYPWKDEPLPY
jgi:3-methyladenine DNA glycosylase/8-oxoguanine DNA glycosylase